MPELSGSVLRLYFGQPRVTATNDFPMLLGMACGLVALLVLPFWLSPYALLATRDAIILGVFALSYDLLWGKAGVLTLGHGAFFGLGAYGLAIVTTRLGWSPAVGFAVGTAAGAAFAAALGYFLIFAGVRLHYFTILTLAVLLIVGQLATSGATLTGGDVGILGVPGLHVGIAGHAIDLSRGAPSYFVAVVGAAITLLVLWCGCRGNYGRLLAAIGMNEFRAKTFGNNTSLHLLIVFTASAALAAFSGALLTVMSGVVAPDVFSPLLSTEVILWVAIGGRGTLLGPLVATVLLTRIQGAVSSYSTNLWPLILGFLLLGLVLFLPRGLAQVKDLVWWPGLTRRSSAIVDAASGSRRQ